MPLIPRAGHRGFTFVEIAIVLMIVGVLAWISVPAYQGYIERARVKETVVAIGEMSRAIRQYEIANGTLPDSLASVKRSGSTETYGGAKDPWGYDIAYYNLRNAKGNGMARKDKKLAPLNSDFDLYSLGPDGQTKAQLGQAESRDDIIRARDGAFIGTAEEFDPS